jgi:YD repeat-containing protein
MKRLFVNQILLVLLLSGSQQFLSAQAPNALAFPSANNNFLGVVANTSNSSEIGVDLYTGTGQFNVPICNLSSKELSIPVSLMYTGARGIKVQEYASSVGLGWSLNAGGNISRVVRGWPDERPEGYLGTNHWGQYVANYVNNGASLPSQIVGSASSNPSADGEPDIFFIRTPYFSAQFTFDEFGVPVFSNGTGLKIVTNDFYNSYNYGNSNFKVIDDAGNEYYFGLYTKENTIAKLYGTNYNFPTTWYLDKIVTFGGRDNITFNYTSTWGNDVYTHYSSIRTYSYTGCVRTDNSTTTSTVQYPKFISSIVSSTGQVYFTYANDRRDLPNSARLTSIELRSTTGYNSTPLQTYRFDHSYFGDPSTNAEALRLKLNRITVSGNTTVTAAPLDFKVFTYNTAENLPPHNSSYFDYWGYYTSFTALSGSDDPMQYPQLRQPVFERTKANALIAIKDITGATWQINYDQNNYQSSTAGAKQVGGLRVYSIVRTLPTGENITTGYSYQTPTTVPYGQVLTESYANLVYVWGSWYYWQVMSETPSNVYDLNGDFVGYSTVKTTEQNGSYTITEFNNFSDFQDIFTYLNGYDQNSVPNIISSTSRAYKRGLPKTKTVYTAAGKKVSQEIYGYSSLTNPVTRRSWGYHFMYAGFSICNTASTVNLGSIFSSLVENYRPSQVVHREFDQADDTRYVEKTVNYAYADNKRLVRTITSTDSKGISQVKTSYYPEDVNTPGIPMLTPAEQTAINSLIGLNKTSAVVHETNTKNGTTTQVHNGYTAYALGTGTKVFQTSAASYKEAVQAKKQYLDYDLETGNLTSTKDENGVITSYLYGYNESLPTAKVVNASSTTTATQNSTLINGGYFYMPSSVTFTTPVAGDIVIELVQENYPDNSNITTAYYSLSGPANSYGTLCASYPDGQCNSYNYTVTLPNMPAGTYTLYAQYSYTSEDLSPYINYYYTTLTPSYNRTREFFLEDFEGWNGNVNGGHTGRKSYTGGYTPPFIPPNNRNYKVQWWENIGGNWVFEEDPYQYPATFSGNVDDIRIFPADSYMNTYSYDPEVGMTGETDPTGRCTTYEYDGFSRPNIIRDNEKKIIKKFCYNYSGQTNGCALFANEPQSGTFIRNNCPSGIGAAKTYTVPAGRYYSEASQQDANQQAINDLNANGQQYANDNGECQNIYVRLDKEVGYTYNDAYYSYEYSYFYLRFFSNSGGSSGSRLTLQGPITINVHYHSVQQFYPSYYYDFNSIWPTTVDPGVDEYWVTSEETVNCTSGPNYYDYNCTTINLWLETGSNYIIIY